MPDDARTVAVHIPAELADHLAAAGTSVERRVLEAVVLEEFRAGRMTKAGVRQTLGFEVLDEVDGFLKAHEAWEPVTLADVRRDLEDLRRAGF